MYTAAIVEVKVATDLRGIQKAMKNESLYVVGIGASAGGLQAVSMFLKQVKKNKNLAYVVVQHLKSDHASMLASILSKNSPLPVNEIKQNAVINGGEVYVMPAGYKLRLENGHFILDLRPETEIVNRAINYFFISLAIEMKSHAFGVILSGTGTDGVEGVKEIERLGGIVLVQDPATAEFAGMPENTIHKDHPDYVVSVEVMPALISELLQDIDSNLDKKRTYS